MPPTQAQGINPRRQPLDRKAVFAHYQASGCAVAHQALFPGLGEAFKGRPSKHQPIPLIYEPRQAGGGRSYPQD